MLECFVTSNTLFIPFFSLIFFSRAQSEDELLHHFKPELLKISPVVQLDLPLSFEHSELSKDNINNSHNIIPQPNGEILHFPSIIINNLRHEENHENHENNENQENHENHEHQENINNLENNNGFIPESIALDEMVGRDENDLKTNYLGFIIIIMTNSVVLQVFLLLIMAFFLWNMSYIIVIMYFGILDIAEFKINIDALRVSKFL